MKSGSARIWTLAGGSVTGAAHIKNGLPCQDALRIEKIGRCYIISLSDGHGSASCPYSNEGAEAAVDTAYAVFSSILEGSGDPRHTIIANKDIWLPKQIEQHWKNAVESIHRNKERESFSYELYGATLLSLVAADDFVFALQLGDGDILSVREFEDDLRADWVIPPSGSLGPETNSLCQDKCWQYIQSRIIPLEPGTIMFMLATDGYANSFNSNEGFKQAGTDFYKLWHSEGLTYIEENLENWLTESSARGSGDDITVALVMGK